jgi:ParB-like chromosome segregation protein Spo0J
MQTPKTAAPLEIQIWSIERLVLYARNPRKNDAAVDRMCSSIREFGFKVPVLARSDGEVVDGHLRLKAARKLGSWPGGDTTGIPVILCDEWSPAQVKAFRLMVNQSVAWADWDDELLALELQELNEADFDLSLTGFDPKELDDLLLSPENDDQANAAPPLPETAVSRSGDLWLCGSTECFAGMRRTRKRWGGCWASGSRPSWLPIRRMASSLTLNGATGPG